MRTARMLATAMGWVGLVGFPFVGSGCGDSESDNDASSLRSLISSGSDASAYTPEPLFGVAVNTPEGTPRLSTGELDAFGTPITIACSTCHTSREPSVANASTADLDEFHQGLAFTHGSGRVSCLSCHNADNYDTLRLADGTAIGFSNSMALCAQCHGPQHRDYQNGAHGGMTGYWDLSRGPRTRNSCVDCHDPHAPAFPHMAPTFKPMDRFLHAPHGGGEHGSDGHNSNGRGDHAHSNEHSGD